MKFMLDMPTRYALAKHMSEHMVGDEFGPSTICNIYFDTQNYLLVRRSIEHPNYKEKLRLRSYGQARPQDEVFLELKKKCEGVVYKRRSIMSQKRVSDMIEGHGNPQSQIERELDFSIKRYGEVAPKVYIAYDREAFYDPFDRDFRMTFDRRIRARTERLNLCEDTDGELLLPEESCVLEVKTTKAMPLWLVDFLSANGCFKTNWSKYAVAYERYLQADMKRSFIC